MKIIKIGTWNEQGFPLYWSIDLVEREPVPAHRCCIEVRNEKVYVNGVEIVPWTEERNRAMGRVEENDG